MIIYTKPPGKLYMKNPEPENSQEYFIHLCLREFETYDVAPCGTNQAIIDGKFLVKFDGISYFEIEEL